MAINEIDPADPAEFADRRKHGDGRYRKKIGAPVDNPFFRHSFRSSLRKIKGTTFARWATTSEKKR
ncbi:MULTISPECIES: hypothetical protein [unclassified Rhizobium]|uniref:hypothetical protein n=1 Tax=unclassified Rhizobium TaxID=2613769 RepID=UPI001A99CA61|nr:MULTISPECIES: hypothetical protein [unclassified Rhizobium]MBX5169505.1 hypothetical protein [Rhizobium sp. NZLR1b]MBX5202408.1 hypothetical protein [Rhizobium sp. NZLR1]QSZ20689.1 hypothetical protein J3O30_20720 [Rhizobium sp. NZLR1]